MRTKIFAVPVLVLIAASAFAVSYRSNEILGRVVGVSDGDTITVLDAEKTQHKIRLNAIDAPESHQAFGQRAKQALSEKIFGRDVKVRWNEKDKYGRTLGDVFIDDRYINKEMVEEGWAWHYRQYSNSSDLEVAEQRARIAHSGLWADAHPIAPWDFRHPVFDAKTVAQENDADPEAVTVYVTKTGTKYHRSGCRYLSKSMIPITLDKVMGRYSPCSVCKPPQ